MESNYQEESSEEVADDSSGIGRSYECVFCKRGFNTAQALGGHMNIHRKDRARNKPKQDGDTGPRLGSTPPPRQPHHDLPYFLQPVMSTNSTLYERSNHQHHRDRADSDWDRPQSSNPVIPGDWRITRLSLVEEAEAKNLQDKELDLELRLGWL